MGLRALVIDHDQSTGELIRESLEADGWTVVVCSSGEDGIHLARRAPFQVVVTELDLRGLTGLDVCGTLTQTCPNLPVIVLSASGSMTSVVCALRAGAYDFIPKPLDVGQMRSVIGHCLERSRRKEVPRLAEIAGEPNREIRERMGESRAMLDVYELVRRVAATQTTVLLSGESGTGKELVARALHTESSRPESPFIAINCAAVPANLLESELFGHVKGSFTDAVARREGLFELARDGTLFLDEIGEMPLEMQPKLLRVLQERQIRPVGGNVTLNVHARIIAATNRDLEVEVAQGKFREDLYYRLNVVPIHIPPLRARGEDILMLARRFVAVFATRMGKAATGISPEACRKLLDYHWPGNVRQLENSMERAVALSSSEQIEVDDLPERIRCYDPATSSLQLPACEGFRTLQEQERRHIELVLQLVRGNKTKAAQVLGVDRRTLYRKLARASSGAPLASEPE